MTTLYLLLSVLSDMVSILPLIKKSKILIMDIVMKCFGHICHLFLALEGNNTDAHFVNFLIFLVIFPKGKFTCVLIQSLLEGYDNLFTCASSNLKGLSFRLYTILLLLLLSW